ncbi:MAG TPA: DUF1552 domain-containing protein [Myxococcaceae bacterium]|nr:DUF1552 domain-containing protein [Myxococcaceae bacterium]
MVSRRTLLKGLGAGLLVPFFNQVNAQNARPARLVVLLECNCIYPTNLLSSGARAALKRDPGGERWFYHNNFYPDAATVVQNDDLSTAPALNPLSSAWDGGIDLVGRSAVLLGLSSSVAGGGHSSGAGALSCAAHGAAPTFDAVVAPLIRRGAPFDALRLGTSSARVSIVYETCALGPMKPAGIIVNPTLAYNSTFGSVLGDAAAGLERKQLFDFAREEARIALQTFRGNSNERLKLERYLSSLESLRSREDLLEGMAPQVRPHLPPLPADNPLLAPTEGQPDSLAWLEAQFQIATASLIGGLTNNVVLAAGTSGFDVAYPSSITSENRHNLQHGYGNAANWTAITEITRRHVAMVAKLARTLAATPEVGAEGSMLDHTIIVFMSDNGEQHHSTASEWPKLVIGGDRLGLKTDGRTILYPSIRQSDTRNRQVSNFFNALGHALGDPDFNAFGLEGSGRIAEGPLSELYG